MTNILTCSTFSFQTLSTAQRHHYKLLDLFNFFDMSWNETDETVEQLAQNREASQRIPYMAVLDDMVTEIWKILMPEGPNRPYFGRPVPQVSTITYGQATSLASGLSCYLFIWGNFNGNESSISEIHPGMFINMPHAAQHLRKREEIKPGQPKTPADAVAEA